MRFAQKRGGFTLLELLAVMVIMFMLMGMGTVAMKGLIQGSGISGATSNVKALLTQARQYAISKEQKVYVVFSKDDDKEKSWMTVCAKYGKSDNNYTGYCITETDLPWGSNTLVGATVYNLRTCESSKVSKHEKVDDGGDRLRTPGLNWQRGDGVGFEVAAKKYLPSGMKFTDDTVKKPNSPVVFNPDGSAGGSYKISFQEMYVKDPEKVELEVDATTGWVKVKGP